MKQSLNIKIIQNFVGVSGIYFFSIPLLLLVNIVLTRTLSVSDFGVFSFVLSFTSVLAILVSGGLPMLVTREIATYKQSENWPAYRGLVTAAYRWVVLASFTCALAVLIWNIAFGVLLSQHLIIPLILLPIIGMTAIRNGILKGLCRPLISEAPTQILQPVLLIFGYLIIAYFGKSSATNALWCYFAVIMIVFGLASIILRYVQPAEVGVTYSDMTDQKRWRQALLPFMMISAVALLSTQLAILISGSMGQDEVVAYLRVAERGSMVIMIPFHILSSIIGPHMVAAIRSGNILKQRDIVRQSSRIIFFTSLPSLIVILLFGEQILGLLFGSPYDDKSYLPMVIVSVVQIFSVAFGHIGLLLVMGGHERLTLASQTLALFANFVFCILLIGPFGELGASIGIAIGVIVSTVLNVLLVKRYFGFIPGILLRQSFSRRQ